jgi:hypothetical protein
MKSKPLPEPKIMKSSSSEFLRPVSEILKDNLMRNYKPPPTPPNNVELIQKKPEPNYLYEFESAQEECERMLTENKRMIQEN